MKCSTPEHFPRDQELWVEVNSLGCSGRRWLRSSAGSLSRCLGQVRSGFFFVFLLKNQNQPKPSEATKSCRAASCCELSSQLFPVPPSKGGLSFLSCQDIDLLHVCKALPCPHESRKHTLSVDGMRFSRRLMAWAVGICKEKTR